MKKALLFIAVSLFLATSFSSAECYSYPNTRVQYFDDCSCYACAYTGPGCTACTDGSDTCYTDGASCGPFQQQP